MRSPRLLRRVSSLALLAAAACSHVGPAPGEAERAGSSPRTQQSAAANGAPAADRAQPAPERDYLGEARQIESEAHALFRQQGDLLWKRWTTGAGSPAALAIGEHLKLLQPDTLAVLSHAAAATSDAREALALRLLHAQLATLAIARETSAETDKLERARAALSFPIEGDPKGGRERDLDHLLTDEVSPQKRAQLALSEAKAAAELAPLVLARDAATARAREKLGVGSWAALVEELHRVPPGQLAALAERTLLDTEELASRAVAETAQRNLGIPADRIRRADLPRLLRTPAADREFPPGQGFAFARRVLEGLHVPATALDKLQLDAEPRPAKGARPLALLVDPPSDVRLSYRGIGGLDEERALLHETARALGGLLTAEPRWELGQLGDGAAAEGVAQLFEQLAGDPQWLREVTLLRGEPLDDLVHTMAARRLLSARRAAALVLFEVQRREGANTHEANAKLYRGLLQRATFAVYTDEDAGRWALEADEWIRSAAPLQGEVLAAQLAIVLRRQLGDRTGAASALDRERPEPEEWEDDTGEEEEAEGDATSNPAATATSNSASTSPSTSAPALAHWWRASASEAILARVWALGRSATTADVLRALRMSTIDPYLLAAAADEQLAYRSPERPPEPPKPDYRHMQGDRRPRKRRKHRKRRTQLESPALLLAPAHLPA